MRITRGDLADCPKANLAERPDKVYEKSAEAIVTHDHVKGQNNITESDLDCGKHKDIASGDENPVMGERKAGGTRRDSL